MTMTTVIHKTGLGVSVAGAALAIIGALIQSAALWQPGLVMFTAGFAAGAGYWPGLRSYQFTLWIIAGFVAAMTWSTDLIVWGGFNITHKWIVFLVIQATMFSMGTKLTIQDFIDVAKMPWAVFIGTFCHFVIMPLLGLSITLIFNFPPEVAVGILLIGACPSGLSSTVMVYIANANLALAVSIAAVSTLAATVMTPLWVNLLAGSMIDIQLTAMVMDVVKIVLIPIGAAILHDYLKTYADVRGRRVVQMLAGIGALWLLYMIAGGWDALFGHASADAQMYAVVLNFVAGGLVWALFYNWLYGRVAGVKKIMPTISMMGIIFFTTTAAAAGRENLVQVGFLLCFAMLMHNLGGFLIGYLMSRWIFRMDVQSARTVAFEVGLQNGGMASGLAAAMGKLATVGLASAVMTPLGNVSGSLLANYWRKKTPDRRRPPQPKIPFNPLAKSVKRIITMTTLTLGHALRAVASALDLAETCYAKRPLSVAVCDANGELLSFARMDNAKLLTIELTQRKARTSSRLGCTTQAFLQRLQKEQLDIGYFADPLFTALPAGSRFCTKENALGPSR